MATFADIAAGSGLRLMAGLLCGASLLATILLLPFASAPMTVIPAFLPLYQSSLILVYASGTWLLLEHYRSARTPCLLILGAGSLYTTLIVLVQLISFPNILRPGLIMGQGAGTLTWFWNFWHLAPPLFTLPYAIMEGHQRRRLTPPDRVWTSLLVTMAAVMVAVGLSTLLATRLPAILPTMVDPDGGYWALTRSGVGPALIALTVAALAVLCWRTRLRTVLQLWLAVSLALLMLDNVITDLGAARDTVGWFVGRLEALASGLVVTVMFLRQYDALYRSADIAARERHQALVGAQKARAHLEVVLDAACMGDWELDLTTNRSRRSIRHDVIFGHGSLQPWWGWDRFVAHVVPEDREMVLAAQARALQNGRIDLECRIRRSNDHAVRWIAVHGQTTLNEAGQPVTMSGCVSDITEQREIRARLDQAGRMEAVGQLTGGVAHDFNNLLTVILGSLEMIGRRPDDSKRVERLARGAFEAARRGTDLTSKLLSFSRRQVIEPQLLDVNQMVLELRPLLAQAVGQNVVVDLDLDSTLAPANLDPSQFQAALLNLAGNARDAMPDGGRFRVTTRNTTVGAAAALDVREAIAGDYILVSIADTGIGMDPDTALRAFEPFFTTKDVGRGTGLGLSQVYGFVRQSDGHVRIRTAPAEGCTIELFLPQSKNLAVAAPAVSEASAIRPALSGEVILVVEDEHAVREIAIEILDGLGYTVLEAPDARQALEILRRPGQIDILFSDVVMPGGINGAQLAAEAKAIRPGIKILLTSGYTATATAGTRMLPAGVVLLRKPYLREDLAQHVRLVLAG